METTSSQTLERYDLLDLLEREWIKLPTAVMREMGPATQTLGGLLRITSRETFVAVAKIAMHAKLPTKTVRNHLTALVRAGWISNEGRQPTRDGAPRRTCTIRLAEKTTDAIRPLRDGVTLVYGVLPWWACVGDFNSLPWSSRAVLSVVMARLMELKSAVQRMDHDSSRSIDNLWNRISELGGEKRFQFSLQRLEKLTGLDHKSILKAKMELLRHGVIRWIGGKRADGGHATDMLYPNESFRVVVSPSGDCRWIAEGTGKPDHTSGKTEQCPTGKVRIEPTECLGTTYGNSGHRTDPKALILNSMDLETHYQPTIAAKNGDSFPKSPSGKGASKESDEIHEQTACTKSRGGAGPEYTEAFERWYRVYPRKTQKLAAATAFGHALTRICALRGEGTSEEALDWLCEVTSEFAHSAKGRSNFVPYPTTWLNEGRYEDDPAEWNRIGNTQSRTGPFRVGPGQRYQGP